MNIDAKVLNKTLKSNNTVKGSNTKIKQDLSHVYKDSSAYASQPM